MTSAPRLTGWQATSTILAPSQYFTVLGLQEWLRKAALLYTALPMDSMEKDSPRLTTACMMQWTLNWRI